MLARLEDVGHWRTWRLAAAGVVIGITACAPPGVDTDAATAGSHATIAQIAEMLGQHADVVCAEDALAQHSWMLDCQHE